MLWNYVGFDSSRMTVQGLARQFAVVFGVFAIIGLSWPYLVRLVSERVRISLAYEDGLDAGDRLLIEYLERSPDATWAWYTLVTQSRPDGTGLDKSELLSRIETCPVLPPVVLRAWYYLYTDGAERALRELDGGEDVRNIFDVHHVAVCVEHLKEAAHVGALEVLWQIYKHPNGGDGVLMRMGLVANADRETQVSNAHLVDTQLTMVAFLLNIRQRCLIIDFHLSGGNHSTRQ